MKYFYVFLKMKDEEKNKTYRPDHLSYLEGLEAEGKVFARGPMNDGSGGLVIYIANSLEEAEKLVNDDPYVKMGAREYELKEWNMSTIATIS